MTRPTLQNWTSPPGNAWAFGHMREIIPTAKVATSTPSALEKAPWSDLFDVPFAENDRTESTLHQHLHDTHADSFVVLHGGRIALEWYREGTGPQDLHLNFSVTKSVTGLLAGALAGEGRLDLDAAVSAYVPETKGSGFDDASVRHLLDMSTDLAFVEDHSGPNEDMNRYRAATGWAPGGEGDGLHNFLCSLGRRSPHGKAYRYVSPNTDMLGWVCERVGGAPFANVLSTHLWSPMGAESDADITLDRRGAARSAGGLSATTRDIARVGQLIVDGGRGVVPQWFVEDLFTGGDPGLWAAGDDTEWFPPGSVYRSCWFSSRDGSEILQAVGVHGQSIFIDRKRRVVMARHSHWPESDDLHLFRRTTAFADSVARAITC